MIRHMLLYLTLVLTDTNFVFIIGIVRREYFQIYSR